MFRKLNIVGTLIECNRPGLFVRISAKSWHQLSGTIWPRVSPTRVEITQSRRGTLRGQVDKTHDLLCGLPTLRVRHLSWHTHFYIFHTKSTLATRENPLTQLSDSDVIHRSGSPPRRKPTKCNVGLWGTVCLGTLSIRLTCEVSCFPIFLKIISSHTS